jgi:hypothetical protein
LERIVLGKISYNRMKAITRNKRLFWIHQGISLGIFIFFMYQGIKEPAYMQDYINKGFFYYSAVTCATLFMSQVFTSFIMVIPSFMLAKLVSPEILLFNGYMIYLGGSVALNYPFILPFFRYLLGTEVSQVVMHDEIESIEIKKARFLKPAYGYGKHIAIVYKGGEILTGIWLDENEKVKVVNRIKLWITHRIKN